MGHILKAPMKYNFKDIVLVPYPYIDSTEQRKQRPALVVGKCSFSRSYILAKITSTISQNTQASYIINDIDVEERLKSKCQVSTDILFTIAEELIVKKISRMKRDSFDRVKGMILNNFEE